MARDSYVVEDGLELLVLRPQSLHARIRGMSHNTQLNLLYAFIKPTLIGTCVFPRCAWVSLSVVSVLRTLPSRGGFNLLLPSSHSSKVESECDLDPLAFSKADRC